MAFIKTQEQDLLIPIKKDGERLGASQRQIIEYFNKQIIAHNKQQKESYGGQSVAIGKVVDYLSKLDTAQFDKIKLKKRFSGILEYYMTEREKMTMLSKQADVIRIAR